MKTLFLTVATAALIMAAPSAFAADDHHGGDHAGGAHTEHTTATHTEHAAPTHTDHAASHTTMTTGGSSHHGGHSHHGMPTTTAAPTGFGNSGHTGHGDNHGGNDNHGNSHDRHGHSGGLLNGILGNGSHGGVSVHINFNRHNATASHHYHYRGGAYRGPSGYSYHRYSYGETLPSIYFGRDYWIDDYSDYGLADPPDGCVWVRYGNDAVLIDENSGEILEVVYGQFY